MEWALSWSQRQNALHIEPFEDALSKNRKAYTNDQGGDYRLLHVGPKEEVEQVANAIRGTMRARGRSDA